MADMTIDSAHLERLYEVALFGPRERRLELLNKLRGANSKDPVSALTNATNPNSDLRDTSLTALDASIDAIGA